MRGKTHPVHLVYDKVVYWQPIRAFEHSGGNVPKTTTFFSKEIVMELDTLKKYFYYNDGCLFWNKNIANKRKHDRAGFNTSIGYRKVKLFKKVYLEHRLIFMLNNGYLPKIIDHVDRNKSNNDIKNLREVTRSQNSMNMKARSDGFCGVKNVKLRKGRTKNDFYEVSIKKDGKEIYIGCFYSLNEASLAAKAAQQKYHQEFAPI